MLVNRRVLGYTHQPYWADVATSHPVVSSQGAATEVTLKEYPSSTAVRQTETPSSRQEPLYMEKKEWKDMTWECPPPLSWIDALLLPPTQLPTPAAESSEIEIHHQEIAQKCNGSSSLRHNVATALHETCMMMVMMHPRDTTLSPNYPPGHHPTKDSSIQEVKISSVIEVSEHITDITTHTLSSHTDPGQQPPRGGRSNESVSREHVSMQVRWCEQEQEVATKKIQPGVMGYSIPSSIFRPPQLQQ